MNVSNLTASVERPPDLGTPINQVSVIGIGHFDAERHGKGFEEVASIGRIACHLLLVLELKEFHDIFVEVRRQVLSLHVLTQTLNPLPIFNLNWITPDQVGQKGPKNQG